MWIVKALLLVALAAIIHETGHWLAARCYGRAIKFRFTWSKLWRLPVPRFIWDMPTGLTPTQKRVIALSGFGAEITAGIPFMLCSWWMYAVIVAVHLITYPLYAGEYSDFKWVRV